MDFLGNTIFVSINRVEEYKARGYVLLADTLPKKVEKSKVETKENPKQTKKKTTSTKKKGVV